MRIASSSQRQRSVPTNLYTDPESRWDALTARDEAADGRFWFSVSTTRIYCYPSCAARRPRREHVNFHDSREAVERAGFRACKRCRPDLPPRRIRYAEAVAQACRTIKTAEQVPTLKELAAAAGVSPQHFQRRFKDIAGVTPKQYAIAYRAQRVRRGLSNAESVTEAIYGAGFNSSGRFYENSREMLGMNPSDVLKGAPGELIRWEIAETSLGPMLVGATGRGICAILFGEDREKLIADIKARFPRATLEEADRNSDFSNWVTRALALVEDPGHGSDLPLDVQGTAFQRRVWAALCEIPRGETVTYGELAASIGKPKAARAVAGACAANAVAVAIPCHRVIAGDGSLSGYRWGTQRKQALLDKETKN